MRIATLSLLFAFACSSTETVAPAVDAGSTDAATTLPSLGLNDVSILVPLPASPADPGTLGPLDSGAKGVLLPQALYDKVPPFGVKPAEGLDFARMRVVAIRFDGCFPRPAGCEAQVRLVMQPITDEGASLDSALHLFYVLTEAELTKLVPALRRLRTLAPELKSDSPLDVNAALAAQGLDGTYGKALRALVLEHAGEENLVRMTFFLRAPPKQEEWFFGGLERIDGTFKQMDIVGVGKANQRVNRPVAASGYTYTFTPAPTVPENIQVLLTSEDAKAATAEARTAALSALARIENPTKYGPDNLSCAGCHVSTFVAESTKNDHGLDIAMMPDAYKSTRNLTRRGAAATTPSSLRAFGYFGSAPMIGSRVLYESAAVVDDLEKRFPAK